MAASEDLTLRMRATGARSAARDIDRTTGSVRKLDRAADRTGRSMKRSSGSVRLFSTGLKPVARIATGAAGALGVLGLAGAARSAIGEFRESQKVGNQTAAVLKSIGAGSWTSSKQVGDLANAISLKTGIDDEQIQSASNLLLTFGKVRNEVGKGSDIFNRATAAAVDLSAAGFGSTSSTAKQLGKALNDPVKGMTALGRAGVTFTKGQKKQIEALVDSGKTLQAQKLIIGEVERQVKGSAAAQADPIDKMKVAWNGLLETLGGQLWPTITRGIDLFSKFVGQIQANTGAGGQLRGAVVGIAGALGAMVGFVKRNSTAILALSAAVLAGVLAYKAFLIIHAVTAALRTGLVMLTMWRMGTLSMTASQWGLNAALLANPIAIVIIALVAIGAALFVAYKKSETFRNAINGVWGVLKGVGGFIGGAFISTINVFISGINLAIKAINLLIKAKNMLPGKDTAMVGEIAPLGGASPSSATSAAATLGRRARGGTIDRAGVYEVGERGRERVHLPAGANVEPNGGFGGDIVIHNYTTLDGKVLAKSTHRQAIRKAATR